MSPESVTDKIKRINNEALQKQHEQKIRSREETVTANLTKQRIEIEKRATIDAERKRMFWFLIQSGVVEGINEIQKKYLSLTKHNVLCDFSSSFHYDLVWGRKYHIHSDDYGNQTIEMYGPLDKFFSLEGHLDYSRIRVGVNDSGDIAIEGKQIDRDIWQRDKDIVIDALARAFINPSRFEKTSGPYNLPGPPDTSVKW